MDKILGLVVESVLKSASHPNFKVVTDDKRFWDIAQVVSGIQQKDIPARLQPIVASFIRSMAGVVTALPDYPSTQARLLTQAFIMGVICSARSYEEEIVPR